MFASRVLVVAVACGVLLACAPARADDKKPPAQTVGEPAPKKLAVIRIPGLDAGEAATALTRLFPPDIGVARLPLFNALLVWGTDEEVVQIRKALTSG